MLISGVMMMGSTCVFFGFLEYVNDKLAFTILSFVIRITEAIGNASYMTASFSIATQEFSSNLATMISTLEIFYGVGLAVAPMLGGGLFEIGGFVLPFAVCGFAILVCGILIAILIPDGEPSSLKSEHTVFQLLAKPRILLSFFSVVSTLSNIGFLDVALEPYLRQFSLSPGLVGLFFFLIGLLYATSSPLWGMSNDKGFHHPYIVLCGSSLAILSFSLIGPAPYIPLDPSIILIIISIIILGISFGALMVASFVGAQKDALLLGLPDNITTFGLISGLWTSGLALGAFSGPTISGYLLDAYGFRKASLFVVCYNSLLLVAHAVFLIHECIYNKKKMYKSKYVDL